MLCVIVYNLFAIITGFSLSLSNLYPSLFSLLLQLYLFHFVLPQPVFQFVPIPSLSLLYCLSSFFSFSCSLYLSIFILQSQHLRVILNYLLKAKKALVRDLNKMNWFYRITEALDFGLLCVHRMIKWKTVYKPFYLKIKDVMEVCILHLLSIFPKRLLWSVRCKRQTILKTVTCRLWVWQRTEASYRIADVANTCPLEPISRTTADAITTSRSKSENTEFTRLYNNRF